MDLDDSAKLWTWGLCKLGSYKFLNVIGRELGWWTDLLTQELAMNAFLKLTKSKAKTMVLEEEDPVR